MDAASPASVQRNFPLFFSGDGGGGGGGGGGGVSGTPCAEVELGPGEVLYIPAMYFHQVEALSPSISVNTYHSTAPALAAAQQDEAARGEDSSGSVSAMVEQDVHIDADVVVMGIAETIAALMACKPSLSKATMVAEAEALLVFFISHFLTLGLSGHGFERGATAALEAATAAALGMLLPLAPSCALAPCPNSLG